MVTLAPILTRLRNDRRGVTALEYGLIAALIGLVVSGAGLTLGKKIGTVLTYLASAIGAA